METWSSLVFPLALIPTSTPWREIWLQAHLPCAGYCFSCLSENRYFLVGKARLRGHLGVISCYYAFVFLLILEYCSLVWGSVAEFHLHLLERQVYSVTGLCHDQSFCRCVIYVMFLDSVCCTRFIRIRITVCALSFHLLLPEVDIPELRPQLIHWSLKYKGV